MIDPFSPEADPGHREEDARVGRRAVVVALAVLPAAASACTHRFCRYHRG